MADIFLSYASQDRARVKPLAEALEARGFSVWWDRALGAGEDYTAVIGRELQAAKAVVVVWTDASSVSSFVRDEAGRARDEGRLVPVMLDKIQLPLGFGSFQAEDFSAWNGHATAPQMQLLEEALHAKMEGRAIDGGAVAAKRRRLMTRIRLVSVLTVVAALVVIAVGVNTFLRPAPAPVDSGARLLDLVDQGKLTPEQAIQLAQALETGALGQASPPAASGAAAPAPAATPETSILADSGSNPSMMARSSLAPSAETSATPVVTVSDQEFQSAARQTFREDMATLLTHPDASVRQAAVQLANANTRAAAIQTLWTYANNGGAGAAAIYRVCGAVGEANNEPLGLQALERARNANPQDTQVWRMLSYSYRRANRATDANAAGLVAQGLTAQAQGDAPAAEQNLQAALPQIEAPEGRAFVEGALGDAAASRNDWATAARRYGSAYQLRDRAADTAGHAAPGLQVDAQKLVRALDRDGRTEEACAQLRAAQRDHDVAAPDTALAARCAPAATDAPAAAEQQRAIPERRLRIRPRSDQQPAQ